MWIALQHHFKKVETACPDPENIYLDKLPTRPHPQAAARVPVVNENNTQELLESQGNADVSVNPTLYSVRGMSYAEMQELRQQGVEVEDDTHTPLPENAEAENAL